MRFIFLAAFLFCSMLVVALFPVTYDDGKAQACMSTCPNFGYNPSFEICCLNNTEIGPGGCCEFMWMRDCAGTHTQATGSICTAGPR